MVTLVHIAGTRADLSRVRFGEFEVYYSVRTSD